MKLKTLALAIIILFIPVWGWAADLYVSSSGSNTPPYDSWAKAANDVFTAYNAASAGDTIHLDDETFNLTTYLSIAKSITLTAKDSRQAVIVAASGSGRAIHISSSLPSNADVTLDGLVIDGNGEAYSISISGLTIPFSLNINNCQIKNSGSVTGIFDDARSGAINIEDSDFSGTMRYGYLSQRSGTVAEQHSIRITNCTATLQGDGTNICYGFYIIGVDATPLSSDSVIINGVTGVFTPNDNGYEVIYINRLSDAVIANCNITLEHIATYGCEGIFVAGSSSLHPSNSIRVANNTIRFHPEAGYGILIGATSTTNYISNVLVEDNNIRGDYYSSATPHCISVGADVTGRVTRNVLRDAYVAIQLSKTQDVIADYNLAVDCYGYGFVTKGATSAKFYNNTYYVHQSPGSKSSPFRVLDRDGVNTVLAEYKNNILVNLDSSPTFVYVATSQNAEFANNLYYSTETLPSNAWSFQGVDYGTFSTWSSAHETTALWADPLLTSDYHLSYNSPCIDAGTKLSIHGSSWRDLAGNTQRYGSAPNIGCYEKNTDIGRTWGGHGWGSAGWGVGSWHANRWLAYTGAFEAFNVSDGAGAFEAFNVSDGAGGYEAFNVAQ